MKHRIFKSLPALAFSFVCSAVAFAQAPVATPTSSAGSQRMGAATKSGTSPKTKARTKRAGQKPQTKPAAQATAVSKPTPPPTASPSPEAPAAAPTPDEAPDSAQAESTPAEEEPEPEKIIPVPTAEARLREQLKVVEQMVAQGLKQEALAELHLLAAEDRFDPQGFYNIANAFARLDATDAAVSTYRKAIEQRKGHYSRALNNMGVVLLRQGFWDQAYQAFLSALRIEDFRYAEASYNLGRLYATRGEMDRALREWKRAVTVDPKHEAAVRALSNVRTPSSSSPAPNAAPAPTSAVTPVRREASASMKAERRSGKAADAQPYTLNSETYALLQQGRTAHERGRYEDALVNFRKVISRMGGYFSPANLELSYSLIELGRNDDAISELMLVAERDGARFPITYYHLGRLYELRGDLKLAEENYLRATQSYQSENAQFLLNLSAVREKRGDFAGALVAMENYIKRKEQQGQKPDWSEARLASLREKAAAAQNPPKQ